jgi:hypothetical protein
MRSARYSVAVGAQYATSTRPLRVGDADARSTRPSRPAARLRLDSGTLQGRTAVHPPPGMVSTTPPRGRNAVDALRVEFGDEHGHHDRVIAAHHRVEDEDTRADP